MLLERTHAKRVQAVLGRTHLDAAKAVEHGMQDFDHFVDEQKDRMTKTINVHYKRVSATFGKEVFDSFDQLKGFAAPHHVKTMADEFDLSMRQWIIWQTGKQVKDIDTTTRKNLKAVFMKGYGEGLSNREIAKEIRAKSAITNPIRAMRIARTETHSAAVKSVNAAVESTRVEMEREWDAAQDERVRETHQAADGQRRDQQTPYDVGGEQLMYPGDPSGSAENVIQCRCVELFHIIRQEENILEMEGGGTMQTPFKEEQEFNSFNDQMRSKYGSDGMWRGMTDEEMDKFNRLERDFYNRKKELEALAKTGQGEGNKLEYIPCPEQTTPLGSELPGFDNIDDCIDYAYSEELPKDVWLHGSFRDNLDLSKDFKHKMGQGYSSDYLFTSKDASVAESYSNTKQGFFMVAEKENIRTFNTGDESAVNRIAHGLVRKGIISDDNYTPDKLVEVVARDLSVRNVVDNSIYDSAEVVGYIKKSGYDAIETDSEKIFMSPWKTLKVLRHPELKIKK